MIRFFDKLLLTYRASRPNRIMWWVIMACMSLLVANQLFLLYLQKKYPKEYIEAEFAPLVDKYGIQIVYEIGDDFFSPIENPIIQAGPERGSEVKPIRHRVLLRYPRILERALKKYPTTVVKKHLNAIYFAGSIDYHGFKYAGSYDPFRGIIYLVDHGWKSEDTAESTIHHEFSSVLLKKHSLLLNPWLDQNPADLKYLFKTEKDIFKIYKNTNRGGSEEDYENGFMNSYGRTDFENDFNEYSAMIFTYPDKFREIMARYPRVRGKFLVWLKFYQRVDPIFTEDYLLGGN